MPYVQIPRDLNKVKEKFILGLTKRQAFFFAIGIAIGLIPFFALVSTDISTAVVVLFFCVVPFGFVGMYERNGFTAERLFINWFRANFLRSKVRLYKTENVYVRMEQQHFIDKEAKKVGYKRSVKDKIITTLDNREKRKRRKKQGAFK